jgi:hypothetical protein
VELVNKAGDNYSKNGGTGTLSVIDGAAVNVLDVEISSTSLLAIDAGRNSALKISSGLGTITNNGKVRILAGAGAAVYPSCSPISAGIWSGKGTYQAIGGKWDATNHKFTASSVVSGTSSSPVALNLATNQRALIDDAESGKTGWQVGASFPAAAYTTNITFTATAMGGTTLDLLKASLPTDESILSGWTFSTTNFTASSTNPLYLSFKVGSGNPASRLEVWHYDTGGWSEYAANDLAYDGSYASFTATDLSGYAMVAVPEPGTLALLVTAFSLGLLACARWKRRQQ